MYELKDRRTDEDQGPSVEDQHSDEQDRLARRAGIRQQMAEHAVELQRAAALEDEVRQSHLRVEAAAELHRQETEPIQAELETLEKHAVRRIAERAPADQEADRRRRELIGQIAAANSALELVVDCEKKLRRPAEIEAGRLRQEFVSPAALEVRLGQPGLANPELEIQLFTAQQAAKFASARQAEAVRAGKIIAYNCQEIRAGRMSGDRAAQERRLAKWQAELAAAGEAATAATAEGNRIHRQILDE